MIRTKDVLGLYANKDRSLVIRSDVLDVLCLLIRPCNKRIRLSLSVMRTYTLSHLIQSMC